MLGASYLGEQYAGFSPYTTDSGLFVLDSYHGLTSDNIQLVQHVSISVDDALHGHTVENITLVEGISLVVSNSLHGHTADGVTLTQHFTLALDDTVHTVTSEEIILLQNQILDVSSAIHAHLADNVELEVNRIMVAGATHSLTSDNVVLTQHYTLSVDDSRHSHFAETILKIIDWTALGVEEGNYYKRYGIDGDFGTAEATEGENYKPRESIVTPVTVITIEDGGNYTKKYEDNGIY